MAQRLPSTKRRRPRFSVDELEALVNGVNERKDIINCKECDTWTNKQKSTAWEEIAKDVNDVSSIDREKEEIRRKWHDWCSVLKTKFKDTKRKEQDLILQNEDSGPAKMTTQFSMLEWKVLRVMKSSSLTTENLLDSTEFSTNNINKDSTEELLESQDIPMDESDSECDDENKNITIKQEDKDNSKDPATESGKHKNNHEKANRRPNFNLDELESLLEAVTKRRAILIDLKGLDSVISYRKNEAWKAVQNDVNKVSLIGRDLEELRRKWLDWTSVVKSKDLKRRQQVQIQSDTSGSIMVKLIPPLNSIELKVMQLVTERESSGVHTGETMLNSRKQDETEYCEKVSRNESSDNINLSQYSKSSGGNNNKIYCHNKIDTTDDVNSGEPILIRQRRHKFNLAELNALLRAVLRKSGIINSKLCDSRTCKQKQKAWKEVQKCVNKVSPYGRDAIEVKRKWHDWVSVIRSKEKKNSEIEECDSSKQIHQFTPIELKVLTFLKGNLSISDLSDEEKISKDELEAPGLRNTYSFTQFRTDKTYDTDYSNNTAQNCGTDKNNSIIDGYTNDSIHKEGVDANKSFVDMHSFSEIQENRHLDNIKNESEVRTDEDATESADKAYVKENVDINEAIYGEDIYEKEQNASYDEDINENAPKRQKYYEENEQPSFQRHCCTCSGRNLSDEYLSTEKQRLLIEKQRLEIETKRLAMEEKIALALEKMINSKT